MCSVGDDVEDIPMSIGGDQLEQNSVLGPCKKCGENSDIILRKKDPLCRVCFLTYCTHKFRATIGKSRQVKPRDKILLVFSGDACSSAMLHMVKQSLAEEAHKRLLINPGLIYIDDGAVHKLSPEERESHCKEVWHLAKASEFPFYTTALEMNFRYPADTSNFYCQLDSNSSLKQFTTNEWIEKLTCSLSSFTSATSKDDFIKYLRNMLLTDVAKSAGFNKIFVGDCATNLSAKLLANIAQGRGSQLPSDIGFVDSRYTVPILHPLREFLINEIIHYNSFYEVPHIIHPLSSSKSDSKVSIFSHTEKFVNELQENFPATISTIMRTGDKLRSVVSSENPEAACIFCKSPLDTMNPGLCSALEALRISEDVSKKFKPSEHGKPCAEDFCKGKNTSCCKQQQIQFFRSDLICHMCHGCQLMIKDMSDLESLPSWILEDAKRLSARLKMKKEIEDFLIKDD